MQKFHYHSPVGKLKIEADSKYLYGINFDEENSDELDFINTIILKTIKQLYEYFEGKRKEFELPIKLEGTEFQIKVWNELLKIPYGETLNYEEVSVGIGNAKAVRATGTACGKNKLAIVVPCHRVVKKDGSIGNYSGAEGAKEYLLEFEKKYYK